MADQVVLDSQHKRKSNDVMCVRRTTSGRAAAVSTGLKGGKEKKKAKAGRTHRFVQLLVMLMVARNSPEWRPTHFLIRFFTEMNLWRDEGERFRQLVKRFFVLLIFYNEF